MFANRHRKDQPAINTEDEPAACFVTRYLPAASNRA